MPLFQSINRLLQDQSTKMKVSEQNQQEKISETRRTSFFVSSPFMPAAVLVPATIADQSRTGY